MLEFANWVFGLAVRLVPRALRRFAGRVVLRAMYSAGRDVDFEAMFRAMLPINSKVTREELIERIDAFRRDFGGGDREVDAMLDRIAGAAMSAVAPRRTVN